MEERRKQPRKDLMSYSQVFDVRQGYLIGYLADINELGAMVISDSKLTEGDQLEISVQLPEMEKISDKTLLFSVRVAWCKQDLSPEYHNVGFEFKSISDKEKKIIGKLIEKYEFRRQAPNYPQRPSELD